MGLKSDLLYVETEPSGGAFPSDLASVQAYQQCWIIIAAADGSNDWLFVSVVRV